VADSKFAFNPHPDRAQTEAVECITLYVRGTVEERMLAYRPRERGNAFGAAAVEVDDDAALAMLGTEGGGSGGGRAEGMCSLDKMAYLLGQGVDAEVVELNDEVEAEEEEEEEEAVGARGARRDRDEDDGDGEEEDEDGEFHAEDAEELSDSDMDY
jgi:hypothetical protein